MPIGDPRDRFFYPTLTLMIDSYVYSSVSCPKKNVTEATFDLQCDIIMVQNNFHSIIIINLENKFYCSLPI